MNEGTCTAEADLLGSSELLLQIAREEAWRPRQNGVWEFASDRLRRHGVTALTIEWDDEGRSPAAVWARRDNRIIGRMTVPRGVEAPVLHTIVALTANIGA